MSAAWMDATTVAIVAASAPTDDDVASEPRLAAVIDTAAATIAYDADAASHCAQLEADQEGCGKDEFSRFVFHGLLAGLALSIY
jgi:hypothetical protein